MGSALEDLRSLRPGLDADAPVVLVGAGVAGHLIDLAQEGAEPS